jgi:hypothetical protein
MLVIWRRPAPQLIPTCPNTLSSSFEPYCLLLGRPRQTKHEHFFSLRLACRLAVHRVFASCTIRSYASIMATEKATSTVAIEVPPGFKLHTENTSHILLPDNNEAFLNPVQEFNRDLSIACIRTWAAEQAKMQESKWLQRQQQQKAGNEQCMKRRKGHYTSVAFHDRLTRAFSERQGRRH